MRTIEHILNLVCEYLNSKNIDYVIVGGFAVLFYGNPRTTMDIDYVIRLEDENIPVLVKFLKENGFHADEYDVLDIGYLENTAKKIGVYDSLRELREKYESR